jgi:hypothetical protein
MRGLKQPRVDGAGRAHTTWSSYDLKRISDTLTTHLPGLEILEWSSQNWGQGTSVLSELGSLEALSQLAELTIDFTNFPTSTVWAPSPNFNRDYLVYLKSFLLSNLNLLFITAVNLMTLNGFFYHALAYTPEHHLSGVDLAQKVG